MKEVSLKAGCSGYLQGEGVWGTRRQRDQHVRQQGSHVQEQVAERVWRHLEASVAGLE